MGSTVTTGKRVAALKTKAGNILYVLWEQTYEKNCHPYDPKWSCIYLGPIEAAIERVFLHAASCEGGSLQARNGHLTPEGYIQSWLRLLAEPRELVFTGITLAFGGGYSVAFPESTKDAVLEHLNAAGRADIVDCLLTEGKVTLFLDDVGELIVGLLDADLTSSFRLFYGWSEPSLGSIRDDLGYRPKPAKAKDVAVKVPAFLKVDRNNRLIQREDGSWYCGGWEYSIVAQYVAHLWEDELRHPGCYRKRIPAYRDAIAAARHIPGNAKVVVDRRITLPEQYQRDKVADFPKSYPVTETATGYEVTVTGDDQLLWRLTHLPAECTAWVFEKIQVNEPELQQLQVMFA